MNSWGNVGAILNAYFSNTFSLFGEFPAQMASNAEGVSISWRHHAYPGLVGLMCVYTMDHHCLRYLMLFWHQAFTRTNAKVLLVELESTHNNFLSSKLIWNVFCTITAILVRLDFGSRQYYLIDAVFVISCSSLFNIQLHTRSLFICKLKYIEANNE